MTTISRWKNSADEPVEPIKDTDSDEPYIRRYNDDLIERDRELDLADVSELTGTIEPITPTPQEEEIEYSRDGRKDVTQ